MALPASGQISLSDFNTELGNAAGTQISLNSSDVRALLGTADGATASFSDYYGASSVVDIALTISSNTNNYNIFSNKGGTYSAGKSNITLTVNSGVTVGSTSAATYALDTGTGWTSGDTITIVNNGTIVGKGGAGGNGSTARANSSGLQSATLETAGTTGGSGGHAFRAQFATTITNNGTFAGAGGGGGGGGAGRYSDTKLNNAYIMAGGAGGGGAGTNAGSGGTGGTAKNYWQSNTFYTSSYTAANGSSGTATTGGAGSESMYSNTGNTGGTVAYGGAGGGLGSAGSGGFLSTIFTAVDFAKAGGASGNYAVGNSNITWSVTGTRLGGVS